MSIKVLAIGAHTDDIELMCGGTIAKFIENNCHVYYTTFSFADKSLTEEFSPGVTKKEVYEASTILGVSPLNVTLFNYDVRDFPKFRQDILENLIELRDKIEPNFILTHNTNDTHQDHKIIAEETYRAFKQTASIWGYESFHNNRTFNNTLYVKLTKRHIDIKLDAISKFKSQIIKYDTRDIIKSLSMVRGAQVRSDYAECFEVMRMLL